MNAQFLLKKRKRKNLYLLCFVFNIEKKCFFIIILQKNGFYYIFIYISYLISDFCSGRHLRFDVVIVFFFFKVLSYDDLGRWSPTNLIFFFLNCLFYTLPVTRSSWAPTITLLRSAENSVSPRVSVTRNTLAWAHSNPSFAISEKCIVIFYVFIYFMLSYYELKYMCIKCIRCNREQGMNILDGVYISTTIVSRAFAKGRK